MKVQGRSETVNPYQKNLNITDYIDRGALEQTADLWVRRGENFDEFIDWVKEVITTEYAYWLSREHGEPFTVEFVSFTTTENMMLDALWYG